MDNSKLAYAVALALGSVSAHAAAPAVATCQGTPSDTIYVAGSSAAQNAFGNAIGVDLFGGTANQLTFSANNGNFEAFCGTAIAGNTAGIAAGDLVVIQYRAEGGSVVGALPIVSGNKIKFLDLTNTTLIPPSSAVSSSNVVTVTTTGTSLSNGTTDSWTGPLTQHTVEVGVTDVEPGALTGKNYPTAYSTAVFGSATAAQLGSLTKTALFDQVFGIAVNTGGSAIDLTKQDVANILSGQYTDFSVVPSASGGAVSSGPEPIQVVNREAGSGTRTGAGIYFLGVGCLGTNSIAENPSIPDQYATGDALKVAQNTGVGAVTYASIDQLPSSKYPALVFASINGIAPTNLAATSGEYDWWYEAQLVKGTLVSAGAGTLYPYFTKILSAVSTAPHVKDILAIPNVAGNTPSVPVAASPGSATIYVNPFTRAGVSCNVPKETN